MAIKRHTRSLIEVYSVTEAVEARDKDVEEEDDDVSVKCVSFINYLTLINQGQMDKTFGLNSGRSGVRSFCRSKFSLRKNHSS